MTRRDVRYAGIRTDTVIGGNKDGAMVVDLLRAPISTAQATVITPRLADHLGGERTGPVRCTESATLGRFCGVTQSVTIALDACRVVRIAAIVAPIRDRAVGPAIVGANVLRAAGPTLSFAPGRPVRVRCGGSRRRSR